MIRRPAARTLSMFPLLAATLASGCAICSTELPAEAPASGLDATPAAGSGAAAQAAMAGYIETRTAGGVYRHYDPVDGRLLTLTFDHLHEGVKAKEGFQVSCADFVDQDGRTIDMDYFVDPATGTVVQGILHKIDGVKRPYDLAAR